jgi:hypothetical protein
MHSVKYGLIKVCVKTSKHHVIRISNNPIGFSKIAIKLHQQQLYERSNDTLNVFEKTIQELSSDLPIHEYNIHLQNINNNRTIYKKLDLFEIYKMERLYSESDIQTKDIVVINRNIIDDINSPKIAFSAAVGSIVGIGMIFGMYNFFN